MPVCDSTRNMKARTGSMPYAAEANSGATRVRRKSAKLPSAVTNENARSVVSTSLRANAWRSAW